ncbi:chitinase-3-like protein 1, partial [Octopus bimaculoides]
NRVNSLKTSHPGLKTILSVGGWNMGSMPFVNAVVTKGTRSAFIGTAINFLRRNNFDGLDICWQYPTSRGSTDVDKERFSLLLKLIGVVVGSEARLIDRAYDIGTLNTSVDVVSLLTYDFYTPGTFKHAAHTSALYAGNHSVGPDIMKNVVCQMMSRSTKYYIQDKGVPYLVDGYQWVGYEDERSVALKAKFALDNKFGGVMLWAFDVDDFKGICNTQKVYPLLNSVNKVLKGGS